MLKVVLIFIMVALLLSLFSSAIVELLSVLVSAVASLTKFIAPILPFFGGIFNILQKTIYIRTVFMIILFAFICSIVIKTFKSRGEK